VTPLTLPGFEFEQRSVALNQWYTPPELAKRMAELVDLRGKRVLEPSAGSGNLVRAALDAGASFVSAVDVDPRNVAALCERFDQEGRFGAWRRDFLNGEGEYHGFDIALMNPPWDEGVHWRHVVHALKFAPVVVCLAQLAMLEGAERKAGLWDRFELSQLAVCSSRPAFGTEGGKMPVACYVIERNSPIGLCHYPEISFWP
jgi:predicted RNA methylase